MPTVLLISGWRLFFYSNEGHEPVIFMPRKLKWNASIGFIEIHLK